MVRECGNISFRTMIQKLKGVGEWNGDIVRFKKVENGMV